MLSLFSMTVILVLYYVSHAYSAVYFGSLVTSRSWISRFSSLRSWIWLHIWVEQKINLHYTAFMQWLSIWISWMLHFQAIMSVMWRTSKENGSGLMTAGWIFFILIYLFCVWMSPPLTHIPPKINYTNDAVISYKYFFKSFCCLLFLKFKEILKPWKIAMKYHWKFIS